MSYKALFTLSAITILILATGCATTSTSDTKRTGKEQLLISNAIDQSLDKIDFETFRGTKVFLNEKFLESIDSKYIVGSVRHRVLNANAILVEKAEKADYVLEVRSGGIGTDNHDAFIGMPKLQIPGPVPISIPEIRLWSRTQQTGLAKIGIVAIDTHSNQILGQGGTTLAKSDDTNTFIFGVGPWRSGSIRDEVKFATSQQATSKPLPTQVSFAPNRSSLSTRSLARRTLSQKPRRHIRLASQEENSTQEEHSPSNPFTNSAH
ncbi:hypothetical protein MNBD_PLANCTO02-3039 [hydrothermal vent metagenome]|uniref:Uncharacterized protein n=1 Tax=hydrothermal vent metagenome TaxID=652676 RepID=A0A3B1DCC6_9ZZZZ